MNKNLLGALLFISPIISSSVCANTIDGDVLTIDRTVINSSQLQFPNEDRIYPRESNFEVIHYVLMSSLEGERWATVTLKNQADGRREFNSKQLMALFADGNRKVPHFKKQVFDGHQTLTLSLNFGVSKFPLIEIYTREK